MGFTRASKVPAAQAAEQNRIAAEEAAKEKQEEESRIAADEAKAASDKAGVAQFEAAESQRRILAGQILAGAGEGAGSSRKRFLKGK